MAQWSDIAEWVGPTVNCTPRGMGVVQGVVLHIQQGSEGGTEAWQKDPASHVSSHFLAPKIGGLRQMVDTEDMAWAQAAGNPHWISVECEGFSGQLLTAYQVESCAQVLARAAIVHDVPLLLANDPSMEGLGYHAMGGIPWGDHPDCPGVPVITQRASILARAAAIVEESIQRQMEENMPAFVPVRIVPGFVYDVDGSTVLHGGAAMANETMITIPPPNGGALRWGNAWFSLACNHGPCRVRVAVQIGTEWQIWPLIDLVNEGPHSGRKFWPIPTGSGVISVGRVKLTETDPDDVGSGVVPVGALLEYGVMS